MKKVLSLFLAAMMIFGLTACGSTATTGAASGSASGSDAASADYSVATEDTATKTVKIYAEVNGKYFTEVTRHGIVFAKGSNGEKSILRALCSEKDFYQAMIDIGGVPGDNLDLPCDDGAVIEGDKVGITVSWDGSDGEIPFEDCVKTGSGEPYQMDARFGGNIKHAYAANTGCIFCLDSCPVGITSNAAYGFGVVEKDKTEQFYGNPDVLPEDSTLVTVTFTLEA